MLGRRGDEISKRTILWAVIIIVAFASGFGVGTLLWEYSAYDYLVRGMSVVGETLK
jgi:hypothetical protein